MSNDQPCRIVFWNIQHGGGSRAEGIAEQILEWNPDLVALAEFRGTAPSQSIAQRLADAGYEHQLSAVNEDEPSWNAVFLASRFKLNQVAQPLPDVPYANLYWSLARVDTAPPIHILAVHVPFGWSMGRWEYYEAILNIASNQKSGAALIVGDMNTGMTGLDEETEFSEGYMEKVMSPLDTIGWRDPFRVLQPDVDAPTWFSPRRNGFRLDQVFANAKLQPLVRSCFYAWGKKADSGDLSDHAALLLDLDQEAKTPVT